MFILASASPRRRDLLAQIGASFRVEVSEAEEVREAKTAEELVRTNALAKARAVAAHASLPVLGADTVVALAGRIFGKPADEREACEMLRARRALGTCARRPDGRRLVQGRPGVFDGREDARLLCAAFRRGDRALRRHGRASGQGGRLCGAGGRRRLCRAYRRIFFECRRSAASLYGRTCKKSGGRSL